MVWDIKYTCSFVRKNLILQIFLSFDESVARYFTFKFQNLSSYHYERSAKGPTVFFLISEKSVWPSQSRLYFRGSYRIFLKVINNAYLISSTRNISNMIKVPIRKNKIKLNLQKYYHFQKNNYKDLARLYKLNPLARLNRLGWRSYLVNKEKQTKVKVLSRAGK